MHFEEEFQLNVSALALVFSHLFPSRPSISSVQNAERFNGSLEKLEHDF